MMRILLLLLALSFIPLTIAKAQPTKDDAVPIWAQPFPNSILEQERRGEWLVEAQCVETRTDEKDPNFPISIVSITHNFTGPNTLVGQRFIPQISTESYPWPRVLTPGAKSIFAIKWDIYAAASVHSQGLPGFDGTYSDYAYDFYNLTSTASFDAAQYREALVYARNIERVAEAPRDRQVRLLLLDAHNSSLRLAIWAIKTLARSGEKNSSQMLLDLSQDRALSVGAQFVLTQALGSLEAQGKIHWTSTPRFLQIQQILATSADHRKGAANPLAPPPSVFSLLLGHSLLLVHRLQTPRNAPGNGGRIFEYLRLASINPKLSVPTREYAVASIGDLGAAKQRPRDFVWKYLLQQLIKHPDFASPNQSPLSAKENATNAQLAEGALDGIHRLVPYTAIETQTLRALQASAKSPKLKADFDIAFIYSAPFPISIFISHKTRLRQ